MSKILKIPTYNALTLDTANTYCEEDITIILDSTLIPTGTLEINENGEYDVTQYEKANVNVVSEEENLLVKFFNSEFVNITSEDLQGATTIKGYAWLNDENVLSLEMVDTITSVGMRAFSGCTNLTSIRFSNNLESINGYAFYQCTSLTNISLPDSLKNIGGQSFTGCTGLEEVILPDSVIGTVGGQSFSGCTNLKYFQYSNNATHTGQGALYGCTALTKVVLGENINFLNDTTFTNCTSLTTITLPSKVATISTKVFSGCSALKSIKIMSTTIPTLNNINAFENTPVANGTGYIYVQDNLVDSYKTATNWSTYADQIKPLSEYVEE